MKYCTPPTDPKSREIYDEVIRTYKAYGDKDVPALREIYLTAPDLVIFLEGPAMKLVGWNTFETFFTDFTRAYDSDSQPADDFQFVHAGEAAFAFGTVINVLTEHATGNKIRWMARTTICLRKLHGQWKLIHHHDSVPGNLAYLMEPPADPENAQHFLSGT